MQTIQLEYQVDSYPTIRTLEAKKRVAKAIEEYQNGTGRYFFQSEYEQRMETFMKRLELQHGNN